jgi:hypothetical protein
MPCASPTRADCSREVARDRIDGFDSVDGVEHIDGRDRVDQTSGAGDAARARAGPP